MQCHYHWLRLTLKILAALHVPRDSEIWIWGLQLKLLSSGEAQKITRMCLGPVSNHQTLPPYSSSLCRPRGLPNPCGRHGTLSCPNNQRLLVYLSSTAWILAHSWVWPKSLGFQPFFFICEHLSSQKQALKEQFLWKSLPQINQECSRDLCVAMHGLLWWDLTAYKDKGIYPVCIFLCLHLLSFPLLKQLGS